MRQGSHRQPFTDGCLGNHALMGVNEMTTINVTLPVSMPVYVAKLGVSKDVNISKSVTALLQNGLKQKVNDAHADVKRSEFKTDAEYVAAVVKEVDAVIAKIESGNWAARGAPPAMTDEMMAAVLGVSVEKIREMKAAKAAGGNGVDAAVAAEVPESVLLPKTPEAPEQPAKGKGSKK
jgi:hypothetical protein